MPLWRNLRYLNRRINCISFNINCKSVEELYNCADANIFCYILIETKFVSSSKPC